MKLIEAKLGKEISGFFPGRAFVDIAVRRYQGQATVDFPRFIRKMSLSRSYRIPQHVDEESNHDRHQQTTLLRSVGELLQYSLEISWLLEEAKPVMPRPQKRPHDPNLRIFSVEIGEKTVALATRNIENEEVKVLFLESFKCSAPGWPPTEILNTEFEEILEANWKCPQRLVCHSAPALSHAPRDSVSKDEGDKGGKGQRQEGQG